MDNGVRFDKPIDRVAAGNGIVRRRRHGRGDLPASGTRLSRAIDRA